MQDSPHSSDFDEDPDLDLKPRYDDPKGKTEVNLGPKDETKREKSLLTNKFKSLLAVNNKKQQGDLEVSEKVTALYKMKVKHSDAKPVFKTQVIKLKAPAAIC